MIVEVKAFSSNPLGILTPQSSDDLHCHRRNSRRISFGDGGLPFDLVNNEYITARI